MPLNDQSLNLDGLSFGGGGGGQQHSMNWMTTHFNDGDKFGNGLGGWGGYGNANMTLYSYRVGTPKFNYGTNTYELHGIPIGFKDALIMLGSSSGANDLTHDDVNKINSFLGTNFAYNKRRNNWGYWVDKNTIGLAPISNENSFGFYKIVTTTWHSVEIGGAQSGGGGLPGWMGDANTALGAFGIANDAKTGIMDYAIRTNYKSARTYSEFNKLRTTQQAWRTTNTLGKTGATYLKYAKGLGYVGAGLTTAYTVGNTYNYFNNGGTDWRVYGKAGLDVIMTGVGFLGPIGFGISATYFILDNATGNFGGFGQIKP
jgi:hypothetical protein